MVMAKHVAEVTKVLVHRSGYSLRAGFEGGQMPLYRKLPQRGFNRTRFQSEIAIVNVGQLEKLSSVDVNLQTSKMQGLFATTLALLSYLVLESLKSFQVKVNFSSFCD